MVAICIGGSQRAADHAGGNRFHIEPEEFLIDGIKRHESGGGVSAPVEVERPPGDAGRA